MKKNLFTLTELVLIAGCAVIVGALTVAAAASMATDPKTIACADVMRGIEQKLTAWENDHEGYIISANDNGKVWGRQLINGGYFDQTELYNRNMPKNFECPAETRVRTLDNGKKLAHPSANIVTSYDYGLNWATHAKLSGKVQKTVKRSEISNPSLQMRMMEGEKFAFTHTAPERTARHGQDASNILYADGHVAFVDVVPVKGTANYSRKFWFNR